MRIELAFELTRDEGRNFSAQVVAEKLAEEVGSMDKLFMEDAADTRYTVHNVSVTAC